MSPDWEQFEDEEAGGAICPESDCAALVIAYRALNRDSSDHAGPWEFTCSRCGIDFVVQEDELVFSSVPKQWLLGKVEAA